MWRTLFDFLGDLGEGGIIALVLGIMFLVFILPMIINTSRMAG